MKKPTLTADKMVLDATTDIFDLRRLRDYFVRVLGGHALGENEVDEWWTPLLHLRLATTSHKQMTATIDGMLLFGKNPKRFLPQSGIRAICYSGTSSAHAARADEYLKGPLVPLCAEDGSLVESGLVDQAWDFVQRNTTPRSNLEGARRIDCGEYPEGVIREAVGNALVHCDYSIEDTGIMLTIFSNRLEIVSPGNLPQTLTPEKIASGARYARNQTLVNVMRDYGYGDPRGMGIRNKIIPGMLAHNGTEPDLIAEDYRFTVRLWKEPKPS